MGEPGIFSWKLTYQLPIFLKLKLWKNMTDTKNIKQRTDTCEALVFSSVFPSKQVILQVTQNTISISWENPFSFSRIICNSSDLKITEGERRS